MFERVLNTPMTVLRIKTIYETLSYTIAKLEVFIGFLSARRKDKDSSKKIVKLFNDQCPTHIETSQLICRANQLIVFYMRGRLVVKGLMIRWK